MKPNVNNIRGSLREAAKFCARLLVSAFLLVMFVFMALYLALQFPAVQSRAGHEASLWLSERMDMDVRVGGLYINWFDVVKLEQVRIMHKSDSLPMVHVPSLTLDFQFKTLLANGDIHLDRATIDQGQLNLHQADTLNLTGFIRKIRRLSGHKPKKKRRRAPPSFFIHDVALTNFTFSYERDSTETLHPAQFDLNHFRFEQLEAHFKDFAVMSDTILAQIQYIQAVDGYSGLPLHHLEADFLFCNKQMAFRNLLAEVGDSEIRHALFLDYDDPDDLSDFMEKVVISAELAEAKLVMRDMGYFVPFFQQFNDTIFATTNLQGRFVSMRLQDADLQFGKNSRLRGDFGFVGLPDILETFVDLDFGNAQVDIGDLAQYVPDYEYGLLRNFGNLDFSGDFVGFFTDFATKASFHTALGYLETDINVKVKDASYRGRLKTNRFELGKLIGYPEEVQQIDMDGAIEGRGFLLDNADFVLHADIARLGLMGYDYSQIKIDSSHLQKQLFEGHLLVKDPNLRLEVDGEINFSDSTFNFMAIADTTRLDFLNLTKEPVAIKSKLRANFNGLDPKSVYGTVELTENYIAYKTEDLAIDTFFLETFVMPLSQLRSLRLVSEPVDLLAVGDFEFVQATKDANHFLNDFLKSLEADSLQWPVAENWTPGKFYNIDIDADFKNPNQLLHLFEPQLDMGGNVLLSASVGFGETREASLRFTADTINYGKNSFHLSQLDAFARQSADNPYFELELGLMSENQQFGQVSADSLRLTAYRLDRHFLASGHIRQPDTGDALSLEGYLSLLPDGLEANFSRTTLHLLGNRWENLGHTQNRIVFKDQIVHFQDIRFAYGEQSIYVDGIFSEKPEDELFLSLENFDTDILSVFVGQKLSGYLNARANIRDPYHNLQLESEISTSEISIGQLVVGNLEVDTHWLENEKRLQIDGKLLKEEKAAIKAFGYYEPQAPSHEQLNLNLLLDGADLKLVEPFLDGVASEIEGVAIGLVEVKGEPTSPRLLGDALLYRASFRLDYLNTTYTFTDRMQFVEEGITWDRLRLTDENNHYAYLSGGLYHNQWRSFSFETSGDMERFMVLKTTAKDNSLYYGTAIGSGTFAVKGDNDLIDISINAKTEKDTNIFIPLEDEESISERDFITFIVRDSSQAIVEEPLTASTAGVKLDMNLDITEDAYCEIIFDKKAGDIIRGNGKGKIQMDIDTRGDFSMYGDVDIVRGAYNFTLLGVIDKRFDLLPDSRISWNGDPYGATLDIQARYRQMASLAPIILADSTILNQPEVRRRYPIDVLLTLKGDLLSPDLSFTIDVAEYPRVIVAAGVPISIESYIAAFQQRLMQDEQELNRQVFSLIVLRRLSPDQTFAGITESAGGSVGELLTNQLSYWVSQVDENLEIDVDLSSLGPEALNSFQLRLSYTFLDGRLRLTRAGGFTNAQNEADLSSVLGDLTAEYLLSNDGTLRAKAYRRNNINAINAGFENRSTAGISLMHTKSSNSFWQLIGLKKKEKARKEAEEPLEEQTVERADGSTAARE